MVLSMTGFGNALVENSTISAVVEVKTLNSKFLDISLRLPRNFPSEKELEIRNILKEHLERGKVIFMLEIYPKNEILPQVTLNKSLAKAYFKEFQELAQELQTDTKDIFRLVMQMPEIIINEPKSEEQLQTEWEIIQKAIVEALEKCKKFRQEEGDTLSQTFKIAIEKIQEHLNLIVQNDAQRVENIRQKIINRMQEILNNENFDKNRFEQEMIYYIEKLDINEEKTRLQSHINYFLQTLHLPEMSGKKLNFISQEMGREINTIGSKANDAQIQHWVVIMKEELEKIKEQLSNIL